MPTRPGRAAPPTRPMRVAVRASVRIRARAELGLLRPSDSAPRPKASPAAPPSNPGCHRPRSVDSAARRPPRPAPIQNALPKLFSLRTKIQAEILQRIQTNYNFIQQTFINSSLSILNCYGGWNAIIKIPNTKSDEQWSMEILENENVFVHPGHFYDFEREGFLVVSLIQKKDIYEEGIMRVKKFVERNS